MAAQEPALEQSVLQEEFPVNSIPVSEVPEAQEFTLAIKPKGIPLFKLSAIYKRRLKFCIFLHFMMFLVMCAKLSEDILDRMDMFILELEDLFIPKPLAWEYIWSASIIFALVALRGLSKNRLSSLNSYAAGTVVLGVCPLLFAAVYFFPEVSEYASLKDQAKVQRWQNFPIGVAWFIFILITVQVHCFSLYFAAKLIKIWRVKMKRF